MNATNNLYAAPTDTTLSVGGALLLMLSWRACNGIA